MKREEEEKLRKLWEERVFKVCGKLQGSGVLIHKRYILTAAHLEFESGNTYEVYGFFGQKYKASCVYSSTVYDFAVLTCPELPDVPLHYEELARSSVFYLMVRQALICLNSIRNIFALFVRFFSGFSSKCRSFSCKYFQRIRP